MTRTGDARGAGDGGRRHAASLNWLLVVVGLALAGTVLVAVNRRRAATRPASAAARESFSPEPVPAAVMDDLTRIPDSVWTRVGTRGAASPQAVAGDPDTANGKPVVLYIGAEFCPYCAGARWAMVTALARFGSFTGLTLSHSAGADVFPDTPTFSFYGSHYTSPYVVFQAVELAGDMPLPDGRYAPLGTPSPSQKALMDKYDAPPYVARAGGIPFVLVAGRYLWGVSYLPDVLARRTQAQVAATLGAAAADTAQQILANANELAATICAADGSRPTNVCDSPPIKAAVKGLQASTP